jgi:hypothetical protein
MRVFEVKDKIATGGTVYEIVAKHEQAGYTEHVADFVDFEIAVSVSVFLNEREKVFEQNRLKKLSNSSGTE